MFLLNDILDICVSLGFQFSYFEEAKLPLFIPKEQDFSEFEFYSQSKANYFDEILPVSSDFISTLIHLNKKEYSTSKNTFFVYKQNSGIMFRHLPSITNIKGQDLKQIFGKKDLKLGFNLLVTNKKLNGIISTYKFLEYIDDLGQFLNLLILKPRFSFKPFKSKVKNIYLEKNKKINLEHTFLHGVLAVPDFFNKEVYKLFRGIQTQFPIIVPVTEDDLKYFLENKYFISNIIEIDAKEKLYIPDKQGKIPTKVYVQKLLRALGRGKNASI